MPATAAGERNLYAHNDASPIVMRGVQKMHTRVHRYAGTNFQSLHCINLDTATDPVCGSGEMYLHRPTI